MKLSQIKFLSTAFFGLAWAFSAQALTCEQEFSQRSAMEVQVIKDLVQLDAKVSNFSKSSSAVSLSYQQKLKEKLKDAQPEIYQLPRKFQLVKNQIGLSREQMKVSNREEKKKQSIRNGLRPAHILTGHKGTISSIIELPDGRIVSAGQDKNLLLWTRRSDGTFDQFKLEGHEEPGDHLLVLRDGRFVSRGSGYFLILWSPNAAGTFTGQRLEGNQSGINSLKELPDGRLIGGSRDSARIWTLYPDGSYHSGRLSGLSGFRTLSLPDGRVVIGSYDLRVLTLNRGGANSSVELKGHSREIEHLAHLPDGRIVSATDAELRVWEVNPDGTYQSIELNDSAGVRHLKVLQDGRIVSAHWDDSIKIWSQNADKTFSFMEMKEMGKGSISFLLEFGPNTIVTGAAGNRFRIWTLNSNNTYSFVDVYGHSGDAGAVLKLKNGKLVTGSSDQTLIIWEEKFVDVNEL